MKTKADLKFVEDIIRTGGTDVKKCFQCATCSVSCELSPVDRPFPRKEMAWAQWGLKDRLLSDPDIWLCHQCNDCSVDCPRSAKPGDVLASIRRLSVEHYSVPGILGKIVGKPAMLPLLLLVPAVLILLVLAATGRMHLPEGSVEYAKMFPHAVLNSFFTLFFFAAAISLVIGVLRFWKDMDRLTPPPEGVARKPLLASLIAVFRELASHSKFGKCTADSYRRLAHLGVLYGFVGLLIVTAVAIMYILLHWEYPMAQSDPFKILGNLSGIILILGLVTMVSERSGERGGGTKSTYFDWFLIIILVSVAVTGFLTEIARLVDSAVIAYPVYFVHLVFVFSLFVYTPYSKMAHLAYRTAALVHERVTGREG